MTIFTDIISNLNDLKSLINTKLSYINQNNNNLDILELTSRLLNYCLNTSTLNPPLFNTGVITIADTGNIITQYDTFLRAVVDELGFDDTIDNWTDLISQIKFSPTLTLASSSTYTNAGDSITVTGTVTYNSLNLKGVTVNIYMLGGGLIGTTTTDSNGEYTCTFNMPSTSDWNQNYLNYYGYFVAEISNNEDFNHVSSENIQIHYLFYDECSNENNLSQYSSSIRVRGTAGTSTITYNPAQNAYKIQGSGNYQTAHIITPLNGVTGYIIEAEFKIISTSIFARAGFVVHNKNASNSTYNDVYFIRGYTNADYTPYSVNSDGTRVALHESMTVVNQWSKIVLKIPKTGTSYNVKVYDYNGTLRANTNISGKVTADSNIQVGLYCLTEQGYEGYVKNIKVTPL